VQQTVTWRGRKYVLKRLELAIAKNCQCDLQTEPPVLCSAHKMLLDQRTLDHMDFVWRTRGRYARREHDG